MDEEEMVNYTVNNGTAFEEVNENLELYDFVINVCIDGVLCLLGYFGNIMTIIVLQKDKVKTSNSIMLQGLAVFDCVFLSYVVLYVVLRSIYPYTGALKDYYDEGPYIVAFVLPIGWTAFTAAIWMVVAIAFDRYIIVSQPLKSSLICTTKNAKKAVVGVAIAAMLFNAPRWPHYYYISFSEENTNSTSTFVSHLKFNNRNLWNPDLYRKVYHISLTFIFTFIIPFALLIFLNTKLILTLRQAQKKRASLTNQSNKQSKSSSNVNLMMVIIITTFLIFELPDFIASIIGAGEFKVDATAYAYFAGFKECLLVVNSTINFYLYCLFYKRFRQILRDMFLPPKSKKEEHSVSTTVETIT